MSEPEFGPRRMTFDEYLRFEMASEERYDFIDGVGCHTGMSGSFGRLCSVRFVGFEVFRAVCRRR